ncbi:MAG: biphenyl 2,3-dioxygenase [Gammaproteobacteria bacterium]|nr:biphenyl 2,3-dioxygenase [Gammaproteobacteria bacterium]
MNRSKLCLLLCILSVTSAQAAGDLTAQQPIEVVVRLGDADNRLRFYPAGLQFATGKLYKLVLQNPSQQKHYFTSPSLAQSVFTRKVQVVNRGKTLAEFKGVINEIEVYPGATAEWWFVPIKTLDSAQLYCSIKGHKTAGMIGEITIQ